MSLQLWPRLNSFCKTITMKYILMKKTIAFLSVTGFWPKTKESTKTRAFCILFSSSFLLFGSLGYLIVYRKFGSDDIDSIETATSHFGVLYFMFFWILKRDGLVHIVNLLSDFSKFGEPRFFNDRNRQLDYLLQYCIFVLSVATGGVFLCPIIFVKNCEMVKQEKNLTKVCGLVSNVWAPFDYSEYPMKRVVSLWESYCCFINFGCGGIMSFTMIKTMEHLHIRVEQLKDMFPDVVNEKNLAVRKQKLEKWVKYHLHLYDIGELMNNTYRYCLSVIVLCVGILFGCIGISTMQPGSSHNSLFLFMGWFQSICILCMVGQRLLDVFLSVGVMAYDSAWYEKDVDFQKAVLMIMIRARRPVLIYAGPFTNLSHLLILGVLQTSYSYINLLNAK
ncbi:odorant receptor 4 [Tribolium castaneum]